MDILEAGAFSAPMSTMQQEGSNRNLKWFAARAIYDRAYVLKYLEHFGFEYRRIASLPTPHIPAQLLEPVLELGEGF